MEEKKTKSVVGKVIGFILLLIIAVIGGIFLGNKFFDFEKDITEQLKKEVTELKKENKKLKQEVTKEEEQEKNSKNQEEMKELNLSKPLNTTKITYSNPSEKEGNYGLSMAINSDRKSITLTIDWSIFGNLTQAMHANETKKYQITGFSKEVKKVFIGDLGQDAMGITLFYLMNDGTVEYTPMFINNVDSQGNSYYTMNYTKENFVTRGKVNNASDVINFYNVDASSGASWKTVIGSKRDGSFYDLGNIINN